jgi:hypothetical protein
VWYLPYITKKGEKLWHENQGEALQLKISHFKIKVKPYNW